MENNIDLLENNDEGADEGIETSPYQRKERRLVTQPYDMSVSTVVAQIESGDIILEPEYQRNYRWPPIKASRFIESLLLNVPIPTVFLAEEEDITYSVIDGQQRLSSIRNFIKREGTTEELVLEGLQIRSDLNGKKFSDLNKEDTGRLIKQYIRCVVILNDSDPQIKFDVFERLNSGSTHLSEQEIRNCTYRGSFNNLIKKLAENKKFLEMLKLPEKNLKNMTDAENILRFFSYREALNEYEGSVKEFLNQFMAKNRNLSETTAEVFEDIFNQTVDVIHLIFGKDGFSRYLSDNSWHCVFNRAVYDAEMVAFSQFKFDLHNIDIENIKNDILLLMDNPGFIKTIASSTNASAKVKLRIRMMEDCISQYGVRRGA